MSVPKHRRSAMHYLRPVRLADGATVRASTVFEVACGQALNERGHRDQTTKVAAEVTCRECLAIVNPPKPMF